MEKYNFWILLNAILWHFHLTHINIYHKQNDKITNNGVTKLSEGLSNLKQLTQLNLNLYR